MTTRLKDTGSFGGDSQENLPATSCQCLKTLYPSGWRLWTERWPFWESCSRAALEFSQGWSAGLAAEDEIPPSLVEAAVEVCPLSQLPGSALKDPIWWVAHHRQSLMTCPPPPHTHHLLLGVEERAEREMEKWRGRYYQTSLLQMH